MIAVNIVYVQEACIDALDRASLTRIRRSKGIKRHVNFVVRHSITPVLHHLVHCPVDLPERGDLISFRSHVESRGEVAPQLSNAELAIRRLLDALSQLNAPNANGGAGAGGANSGMASSSAAHARHRRAPSFLSGGAPRDRRGRIGIDLDADAKRRGRYLDEGTYPNPNPNPNAPDDQPRA